MADLVINSGNTSVILKSLAEAKTKDLSYEIAPSFPILAKQFREIQPNNQPSGVPAGQEIVFNINKSMLLRDLMIRTAYTTTTTGMAATQFVGLSMFESVALRSNGVVICTLSDYYIQGRVQQMEEHRAVAIYRRALPLVPGTEAVGTTSSVSCITYTPVFNSFFEDVKNHFDLGFYEQLQLVCKFNTSARAGFNIPLNTATASLWVWNYKLSDQAYNVLRAANQVPSRPLNMLTYNTFTESMVLTGATSTQMRLNVNYPVFNTYIMISRNILAANLAAPLRIDSLSFSVGGVEIISSAPHLVASWESSCYGASAIMPSSATAVVRNDTKVICLNWGLLPHNRLSNSGAVSYNQLNYPMITVNYASITPAEYTLAISHEYWQFLSLDSASGSLAIVANT